MVVRIINDHVLIYIFLQIQHVVVLRFFLVLLYSLYFLELYFLVVHNYCLNNPIKYIDPNGEDVFVAISGGINGGPSQTTNNLVANMISFAETNGIKDFDAQAFGGQFADSPTIESAISFINQNLTDGEKLIVYGYSWGGDTAIELADALNDAGISVDLLITVDAAKGPLTFSTDRIIPSNVAENINYYQPNASNWLSVGASNTSTSSKTSVLNFLFPDFTHGNIDENVAPLVESAITNTINK